jgi:adenylosuccinate lyase
MIERYSTPEMAAIWTDDARMEAWLQVELAVCEAWTRIGMMPEDALAEIKAKAAFDVDRVCEIEQTTQHDVIAFVSCLAENVGECSKYIHYGLTSSDVLDTGLALQLRAAGALLEEETKKLGRILQRRALEHRDTVMMGRTHGVHAEPITFGMVLGLWAFEVQRGLERLRRAVHQVAVGKISGAVGNYANVDPQVEQMTMSILHLGSLPSPRRSCSAIAMPSSWPLWPCSRPPSRRSPCRCAITSARRSWKPRSTSLPGRRARRPCPTSATPSSPSDFAARPGSSGAT